MPVQYSTTVNHEAATQRKVIGRPLLIAILTVPVQKSDSLISLSMMMMMMSKNCLRRITPDKPSIWENQHMCVVVISNTAQQGGRQAGRQKGTVNMRSACATDGMTNEPTQQHRCEVSNLQRETRAMRMQHTDTSL
jgi:hypothetical protein